ncbi:MAG TPA: DUF3108 domain-containing protein [Saprospiraceae bacterium]|nr:DUF3108 domain-containing protein [Saprospiraceae bacterium]
MLKKSLILVFFLSGALLSFKAQPLESDFAFTSGERLVYKVFYNWNFVWLPAGEVIFEIKDETDSYHIEVTGKTYSSYEWFYKVRDKYHSYIDKKTGLPKLYIRDIHQGDYRHYEKIVFDYPRKKAISHTGKHINKLKQAELDLDADYYDMISSMYFLRNVSPEKLRSKGHASFRLILDNKKYELNMRYKEETRNLKVRESGSYNAYHAVADVIAGNVFGEGVQMNLWIGNDSNMLPVLIESPLSVGSVKAVLASHSNLKYPFHSKLE